MEPQVTVWSTYVVSYEKHIRWLEGFIWNSADKSNWINANRYFSAEFPTELFRLKVYFDLYLFRSKKIKFFIKQRPSVSGGSATMGRPLHIEYVIQSRPKVPHSFLIHTYLPTRPTRCKKCKELLRGFRQQGLQCRDCKYNACKSCVHANEIGDDCPGDIPDDDRKLTTGPSKIDRKFLWGVPNSISGFLIKCHWFFSVSLVQQQLSLSSGE